EVRRGRRPGDDYGVASDVGGSRSDEEIVLIPARPSKKGGVDQLRGVRAQPRDEIASSIENPFWRTVERTLRRRVVPVAHKSHHDGLAAGAHGHVGRANVRGGAGRAEVGGPDERVGTAGRQTKG